jgi:hypothetical protein
MLHNRKVPMRRIRRPLIALLALAFLAVPAGASGLTTVGQVAPPNPQPRCNASGTLLLWQESVASSPSYVTPTSGAITSWSTTASVGPGQIYTFRVLRPLRERRFRVIGHDGPRTLTQEQLNTFQTDIPVDAGDILALSSENSAAVHTACLFATPDLADALVGSTLSPADGDAIRISSQPPGQERVNVSATLLPPPVIATLSPAAGPPEGGSVVTVAGANFAEVKSVSFGGVAARSFTVASESQLVATAPPGVASTLVPVTVKTAAGSATATFSYLDSSAGSQPPPGVCLVPKLRGRKLKAARRSLRSAGCVVGKVKKVARRGKAKWSGRGRRRGRCSRSGARST